MLKRLVDFSTPETFPGAIACHAQLTQLAHIFALILSTWVAITLYLIEPAIHYLIAGVVFFYLSIYPSFIHKVEFSKRVTIPLSIAIILVALVFLPFVSAIAISALILLFWRLALPATARQLWQALAFQIILLTFNAVFTVSIGFTLQLFIFTVGAMLLLYLLNIIKSPIKSDFREFSFSQLGFLMAKRRPFVLLFVSILTLTTTLAALIFITLPRLDPFQSLHFLKLKGPSTYTGFSDQIKFNDVTDIIKDDRVVMRVDVPINLPFPETPYWRMLTLENYDNGTLTAHKLNRTQIVDPSVVELDGKVPIIFHPSIEELLKLQPRAPSVSYFYNPNRFDSLLRRVAAQANYEEITGTAAPAAELNSAQLTIYLEPGVSSYLPTTGRYSLLRFGERTPVVAHPLGQYLRLKSEPNQVVSYQIIQPDFAPALFGREHALYLMSLTELRITEDQSETLRLLWDSVGGFTGQMQEDLNRIIGRLQKDHLYSTQYKNPSAGADPVFAWLRSTLPGHCEMFATSTMLLARYAGYPARVVVGFMGGEWNKFESYYVVRAAQAHAWLEVYEQASKRWIRFDPTNPELAQTAHIPIDRSQTLANQPSTFSDYLDSLKIVWYRKIINFDRTTQSTLYEKLTQLVSTNKLQSLLKGRAQIIQVGYLFGVLLTASLFLFTVYLIIGACIRLSKVPRGRRLISLLLNNANEQFNQYNRLLAFRYGPFASRKEITALVLALIVWRLSQFYCQSLTYIRRPPKIKPNLPS